MPMGCAEKNYQNILQSSGCADLNCLLGLSAGKLARTAAKVFSDGCGFYAPVADGVELITHHWIMMSDGDVADVPLMYGTNSDEGALFTPFPHHGDADQLHDYWLGIGYT